jgi:hypothetical protein
VTASPGAADRLRERVRAALERTAMTGHAPDVRYEVRAALDGSAPPEATTPEQGDAPLPAMCGEPYVTTMIPPSGSNVPLTAHCTKDCGHDGAHGQIKRTWTPEQLGKLDANLPGSRSGVLTDVGDDETTLAEALARTLGEFYGWREWSGERIVGDIDNPEQFAAAQGKWEQQEGERQSQVEAMLWVLKEPAVATLLADRERTPAARAEVLDDVYEAMLRIERGSYVGGWNRYVTDDEHVLHVWIDRPADGWHNNSFDVRLPKETIEEEAARYRRSGADAEVCPDCSGDGYGPDFNPPPGSCQTCRGSGLVARPAPADAAEEASDA